MKGGLIMQNIFKFKYMGNTFYPVGQISPKMSLKKASLYLRSTDLIDIAQWNYSDFYNAATRKCDTCDVFICEETGKLYIPCENDLMIWEGEYIPIAIL